MILQIVIFPTTKQSIPNEKKSCMDFYAYHMMLRDNEDQDKDSSFTNFLYPERASILCPFRYSWRVGTYTKFQDDARENEETNKLNFAFITLRN